jgi:RNA polymerase sigma factor (sigma-70 family)
MTVEADDMELLRDYVRNHSEQAFRTLVERHIDLVYSVALRQTQQPQLAQDVTQAVFIVLVEKAATISQDTILAGWLFRATRYAAANVRRAEARREHWEQQAAHMEPTSTPEPELERVTPLLNEALEQLHEQDRAAILLRFFEHKSMEEVGRALGTTESAAKMRLSRAVEKLRRIFRRRGAVVPTAVVLALLSAQTASAAPAGLAATVATSALLNQSSASTLVLVKGTLKIMAQAKAKKLAIAALVVLFGGATAVVVQQTLSRGDAAGNAAARENKAPTAAPSTATTAQPATAEAAGKILVFRGRPSWNRHPDFEDKLAEMGFDFEVKPADLMATADLSRYRVVIIPGAQSTSQFYDKYAENAERFDSYVTNGGVLVLELNGAERSGLPMPRGVNMVMNPALDNALSLPNHPILLPLGGRPIRANFASHGYLSGVPSDAVVLATEATDGEAVPDKPTFIEYASGQGRVLAACQCFHDRDNSGRGPLMQTVLSYAMERKWYRR